MGLLLEPVSLDLSHVILRPYYIPFPLSDPTKGMVNYLSQSNAQSARLAYVDGNGVAVMKVDDTTDLAQGKYRDSVRIATQKRYDGGLFVLDAETVPFGWGGECFSSRNSLIAHVDNDLISLGSFLG